MKYYNKKCQANFTIYSARLIYTGVNMIVTDLMKTGYGKLCKVIVLQMRNPFFSWRLLFCAKLRV